MRGKLVGFAVQILVMAIVISIILLFIGIGTMILLRVCIAGRNFRRNFHNNNGGTERGNKGGGNNGLSPDELEMLPCYEYTTQDEEKNDEECSVCLEIFRVGEKCRMLPECKHGFHADCVDSWLLKAAICPTCRTSAKKCIDIDRSTEGIQILSSELPHSE